MAYFTWSLLFAAGQKQNPLDISGNSWKYQYAPYDAICEVMNRATTATATVQITAGSDEVVQSCPVQGGGTIGTTPSRLNTEPVTFKVSKGDLIQINLTAVSGTPTVDGSIEMTPIGGLK